MSHEQLKCQSRAQEEGSFINKTTDIYFTLTMSQALNWGKDIFVCQLYRLSYNNLKYLLNIILLSLFYGVPKNV